LTLVDTNVLIDIISADRNWLDWSLTQVDIALASGPLLINDVVYAELASRYGDIDDLDRDLAKMSANREPIPKEALFAAGHAHARYRRAGGTRIGVLPDFFIGAHAAVLGVPLVTRDAARYRTYFPTLDLRSPQSN